MNNKANFSLPAEWIIHLAMLLMVIAIFMGVIIKLYDNNLHVLKVEARDYAFTRDAVSMSQNKLFYN